MVFTRTQAQTFYDHFGTKQDAQGFYEDAALDNLIAHAAFEKAKNVFEFGSGTGRFASRLLTKHLSSSASYLGFDLSPIMIDIAKQRISPYTDRAKVFKSDGAMRFPLADHSVDRVVSTYVLDLLSEKDIRHAITEAHRVLIPGGKLCLASLTDGVTFTSWIVSTLMSAVFRLHPSWIGGCRPIQLLSMFDKTMFDQKSWSVDYRKVVIQFGVPSEVIIASAKA